MIRMVRLGVYVMILGLLALLGNLIVVLGGNLFGVLFLAIALLVVPAGWHTMPQARGLVVVGGIGVGSALVGAVCTLGLTLLLEGPESVAAVGTGAPIWVASALGLAAYLVALLVERWVARPVQQP